MGMHNFDPGLESGEGGRKWSPESRKAYVEVSFYVVGQDGKPIKSSEAVKVDARTDREALVKADAMVSSNNPHAHNVCTNSIVWADTVQSLDDFNALIERDASNGFIYAELYQKIISDMRKNLEEEFLAQDTDDLIFFKALKRIPKTLKYIFEHRQSLIEENENLKHQLIIASKKDDFLSDALNQGDGTYRP